MVQMWGANDIKALRISFSRLFNGMHVGALGWVLLGFQDDCSSFLVSGD